VNYELMWCDLCSQTVQENDFLGKSSSTQRDTLRGAFDEFEYALIKRGEDCEVHLRLKKGAVISPRVFRNTFSALLRARCVPTWTARLAAVGTGRNRFARAG
jgi:hypothetical protein